MFCAPEVSPTILQFFNIYDQHHIVFPTDLTASLIHGKNPTEEGAYPVEQIPAERAGLPEDIQGPLLYLASRAGAYCNGNCVITDGGKLSMTPATY